LTPALTPECRREEPTSTDMLNRYIVLIIGTDRETRSSKMNATKSRSGVKAANMRGKSR
jgi:hypothetical protein